MKWRNMPLLPVFGELANIPAIIASAPDKHPLSEEMRQFVKSLFRQRSLITLRTLWERRIATKPTTNC
jgi:hypothetical protein